jgi:hypothetical protein
MQSLKLFVCMHPYFSLLVFVGIGILLKSIRRMNWTAIKFALEEVELALDEHDFERAKYSLQRIKTGLGLGPVDNWRHGQKPS